MTDKEKILVKIESLLNETNYEPFTDEVFGRIQSLKELKSYIDSLQEEPVSGLDNGNMPIERWKQAVEAASNQSNYRSSKGLTETRDDYFVDGVQWADEHPKEEPVSEELEKASYYFAWKCHPLKTEYSTTSPNPEVKDAFKAGAKWQKEHLWKHANGDDLPEIGREVIALEADRFCGYKVVFAHRPNPNGWDGKSLSTGNVEHYTPKTYDKGGWNIPNIKYFLDVELPKEIEL